MRTPNRDGPRAISARLGHERQTAIKPHARFNALRAGNGSRSGGSAKMRQEIHYALTLTHWLALDGGRRDSVEELWSDLIFATQRLGYSSVRLALADGQRVWDQTNACQPARSVVQVLQAGRLGTLELKAHSCANPPPPA